MNASHHLTEDEEDAAYAAIYAQRKAELLAAGKDGVLPVEVSGFVRRGDSRLKAIRKWRGIGEVELAQSVNMTQGHLSEIENGKRKVTAELAARLAAKLDVPVAWIE